LLNVPADETEEAVEEIRKKIEGIKQRIDAGEALVQVMYTDSNGEYLFTGLTGEQYIVVVSDSANVLSSLNALLGPNPGADNNAQNPASYVVNLPASGGSNYTADFGYQDPGGTTGGGCTGPNCNPTTITGSIGDQVFLDNNSDGIFNAGDDGIPGVSVRLYADLNLNGRLDAVGDAFLQEMFTRPNGWYQFTGLPVGTTTAPLQYIVIVTDENNVLLYLRPTKIRNVNDSKS